MKSSNLIFAIAALSILTLSFVSAAPINSVDTFFNDLSNSLTPVLKFTLGDVSISEGSKVTKGEILFIKLLVFILMLSIIFYAVQKFPGIGDNLGVVWIVSLAISILGTRFITTQALVNFIWLPSGAVGIALTALLPFFAFFFLIESFDNVILRKVGWIFFACLFLGLAITRWDTLADTSGTIGKYNWGWIYVGAAVLSLIMIFGDRKIRAMMFNARVQGIDDSRKKYHASGLIVEIDEIEKRLLTPRVAADRALSASLRAQKKTLESELKKAMK